MPKISPKIPQNHRKALRDFVQNPYVAARLVIGEFDHLLPPEVKEQLVKARDKEPGLVTIAKERIERGIRAGEVKPVDSLWPERRKQLQVEDEARKAKRREKYGE